MTTAVRVLLTCLCMLGGYCLPSGAVVAPGQPDPFLEAIKARQPRLAEYYEKAVKERPRLEGGRGEYSVPDETRRRRLMDWYKSPRPLEEADFIVSTLLDAYRQAQPDWLVVSGALIAAEQGVPNPAVLDTARKLVTSVRELPDEAMLAMGPALSLLVISGIEQDIKLVESCVSREAVGVKVEPDKPGFVGGPRELVCQQALVAIFMRAPLDFAIPSLRRIVKDYRKRPETEGFDGFIKSTAEGLLEQLKRVRKGETVALPVP